MKYYKTNALYDYLDERAINNFKFPKGDLWALVYGEECMPKVLVLVIGSNNGEIPDGVNETWELLRQLSEKSGLPLCTVTFSTNQVIKTVIFQDDHSEPKQISLEELAYKFEEYGIPISEKPTDKAINEYSSSAYHNWQRDSLGSNLVASDIDLFKVNAQGEIECIYELKRSFIELDSWNPYPVDYNNFKLISNLCNMCKIDFRIAYNRRTTNPWNDDIRSFRVFDVNFEDNNPIGQPSIHALESFIS